MRLLNREAFRTHHALFWAASLAVCMFAYADVIFAHKTFVPVGYITETYGGPPFAAGYRGRPAPAFPMFDAGAEAWFVHPLAYQERRALASGTLPFWNAHAGLGAPMLSNGQIALFNPLHWIELLDPDQPVLWDIHFLLLRLVAALFTCYLLFRLGVPPLIAALGAPLAAVHGSFTALVVRGDLNAYALMPVLLYCLLRVRQERDSISAVAFGAALYLALTAGHPQPAAAVLITCALVGAGLTFWPRETGGRRYVTLIGIASIAVALLSAPYWMPFLESARRSWSAHPPGLGLVALPPGAALQWLVPGIFASSRMAAFLEGPLPAQTFIGGVAGTLAVLGVLASVALPAARRRLVWVAVPLLLALRVFGFPPLQWLGRLPLLEQMSFGYFGFGILYLLAIAGVACLPDLFSAPSRTRLALSAAAGSLVVIAVSVPAWVPPSGWAPATLYGRFHVQLAVYSSLAVATVILVYAGSLVSTISTRRLLVALLGAMLLGELTAYRYELSERGNPTATAPFVSWLQRQRAGPPFRVMGLGHWLTPNLSSAFGLDDVRLCDALVPPEYIAFVQRYFQRKLLYGWFLRASPQHGFRIPGGLMNLLNVRYLVTFPSGTEDYIARNRVAYADPEMNGGVVIENLHAWPRIFAVSQPQIESSPGAALERLGSLDASAPFAVVANDFPKDRWNALCGAGCGNAALEQRVSDIRYGINDLSFRMAVGGPAVVVVSDTMVDGWRAVVDGVEQPIFRANYLFRGLILESGAHDVRFEFRPPGWSRSLWLAVLGLVTCIASIITAKFAKRSPESLPAGVVAANLGD